MNDQKIMKSYLNQLSDNEKKTMEIAKSHLESSFNIEKSNGYLKFKEEYIKLNSSTTSVS
jgi:hypothetical protein